MSLIDDGWLVSNTEVLMARIVELESALRELVTRCDGEEGVRADGSNIQTLAAHAVLGDFKEGNS